MQINKQQNAKNLHFYGNPNMSMFALPRFRAVRHGYYLLYPLSVNGIDITSATDKDLVINDHFRCRLSDFSVIDTLCFGGRFVGGAVGRISRHSL